MKKFIPWLIAIVLIAGVVYVIVAPAKPGQLDEFATCLGDKGAIFYGTFWCPNCRDQKALFGRSAEKLPYVECSTPDGRGQLQECTDLGVERYPTWHFTSNHEVEKIEGTLSLETLAEKTDCVLSRI